MRLKDRCDQLVAWVSPLPSDTGSKDRKQEWRDRHREDKKTKWRARPQSPLGGKKEIQLLPQNKWNLATKIRAGSCAAKGTQGISWRRQDSLGLLWKLSHSQVPGLLTNRSNHFHHTVSQSFGLLRNHNAVNSCGQRPDS